MYIDDQRFKQNGIKYRRVLMRSSYRNNSKVCHETIANLSKCSDKEIDAIKFALAHKSLCTVQLTINGTSCQTIPQPRTLGKLLLEKATITLPDAIPHRNVKVDTKVKLVPKRKTFDN